jgi:hypothetical protein
VSTSSRPALKQVTIQVVTIIVRYGRKRRRNKDEKMARNDAVHVKTRNE